MTLGKRLRRRSRGDTPTYHCAAFATQRNERWFNLKTAVEIVDACGG